MDPVALSQDLIKCPSITPLNEGALEIVEKHLKTLGFTTERVDFEGIGNLFATRGSGAPHLCFAGHTDVVPLGNPDLWKHDPFEGIIQNGILWGRGSSDMKCAIACFISALSSFPSHPGTISLLITGDEEKDAVHGTQRVLPLLAQRNMVPDLCLLGEPTALSVVGDTLKIGRRGSLVGKLTCFGKQGHIAYPENTDNPIPRLLACLQALNEFEFDQGNEDFEPTRLQITSIDVGNSASNIIPQQAEASFGVRLNPLQTEESLTQAIQTICQKHAGKHRLDLTFHGNAFFTTDVDKISVIQNAVASVTGELPRLSTKGATTDGRFIIDYCPVIECGMKEETMHQIDEHVSIVDITRLTQIYEAILKAFYLP